MDTNQSSPSLAPQAASNSINEEYPDPIPETHPRDLGSSEIFYDIEPDFDITDIQTRAIELTILGHNDSQVAQLLRINRRTLWTWKTQNPNYQRALSSARIQAHAGIIDRYRHLLLRASEILAQLLEDPSEEKRQRAALALLNMVGSFRPPQPIQSNSRAQDYFPPPILPPQVG
jgi:hypothetical protein